MAIFNRVPKPQQCSRTGARRVTARPWLQAGSLTLTAVLAMLPMLLAVGGAIDMGRAAIVKSHLQTALDAAGLAVGSSDPMRDDLNTVLSEYFHANFDSSGFGSVTNLGMVIDEESIDLQASASLPTLFLGLIGKNTMEVDVRSEVVRETTGLEVVMVLDNTGSMNSNGKLSALKSASHNLVDILFGQATEPELLKVGLVPFAGSVNVGTDFPDSLMEDYDTAAGPGERYDWGRGEWGGCVEAREYPHDTLDTTISEGGKWEAFHWPDSCYSSNEPNCSDYDHININNWYYASSGNYNDDTTAPYGTSPNRDCSQPLTPLTNNRALIESRIDSMVADGYTHIGLGTVWGWRVISPEAPFSEGVAYDDEDWKKAAIILTDGQNTTNWRVYTGYGYPSEGRLDGTTGGSASRNELNQRMLETCTNMKAAGIDVYTITFQLYDTVTKDLFRQCASEPQQYFDSPNNDALQGAFRAIANQLSNLRVYR